MESNDIVWMPHYNGTWSSDRLSITKVTEEQKQMSQIEHKVHCNQADTITSYDDNGYDDETGEKNPSTITIRGSSAINYTREQWEAWVAAIDELFDYYEGDGE